jgi:hypothetical protein
MKINLNDIPIDDPLNIIWAIRGEMYEETKYMSHEEFNRYIDRHCQEAHKRMKQINPDDYDFPFLPKK